MSNLSETRAVVVDTLTVECYLDHAPPDARLPYALVSQPIPFVPAMPGDSRTLVAREQIVVDVFWQGIVGETAAVETSALITALDGHHVSGLARLRVVGVARLYEVEDDVTHVAVTVSAARGE